MSIILGNGDALKDLDIGNKIINKVVVGNKVVWQKTSGEWPGLKFTSNQDGSTVGYTIRRTVNKDIYTSTDGKTWTSWDGSSITLNNGESIYVWNKTNTLSTDNRNYFTFTMSGLIAASGNIDSMINFSELTQYCYNKMFADCTSLTAAPNLSATNLADRCYQYMFQNCTSLTTAPELPATTLTQECYEYMFLNCTSLITAPELPATTLAQECYNNMFAGCTSLTAAPELPATTLAPFCYSYMFAACYSLTTAPELPATTLDINCYAGMFQNCRALTTAPDLPATTLANYCYSYMFSSCFNLNYFKLGYTGNFDSTYFTDWMYGVSSTGTYEYDGTDTTTGPSAIPVGWVKNYLKFTSQSNNSTVGYSTYITKGELNIDIYYSSDGVNWTAWNGSNITLNNGESIYVWNKTNTLSSGLIRYLAFTMSGLISASGNVNSMINFSELTDGCYFNLFAGCTSLTTAPDLPATNLAENCYEGMFYNCTSLTIAPVLPATNLVEYCYSYMFNGCTSLNNIKLTYTGIFSEDEFFNWVEGVSSIGTLYYNGSDTTRSESAIPEGWTVQTF